MAVKLLEEKPDGYRLNEFVCALKQAYELSIPASVSDQEMQSALANDNDLGFNTRRNLFEHFRDIDLSCLIGNSIIIPV